MSGIDVIILLIPEQYAISLNVERIGLGQYGDAVFTDSVHFRCSAVWSDYAGSNAYHGFIVCHT